MDTVNLSSIAKELNVMFKASEPVMLIGLPGVGKTQIIRQNAREILDSDKAISKYAKRRATEKEALQPELDEITEQVTAAQAKYDSIVESLGSDDDISDAKAQLLMTRLDIAKNALKSLQMKLKDVQEAYNKPVFDGFFNIDMSQIPADGLMIPYIDNSDSSQPLKRDMIAELKNLKSYLDDSEEENASAIFFIDEITSANQDDQRTLMNIVQEGQFPDGTKFNVNRVFFILAGNPSNDMPGYEDYDGATNPVEEAVITRAATLFVEADLKSLLDWGEQVNEDGRSNIHPYLVSALKKDPALFLKQVDDDVRVLNSRTTEKLSNYFYAAAEEGKKWNRDWIKAFAGDTVGNTLATTIEHLDTLVGIDELFGSDKTTDLDAAALTKFREMSDFEKYYLIATATDNTSPISFTKKNNVIKFKKLLVDDSVQHEARLAIGKRIAQAPAKTNARALLSTKYLGDESTNIQSVLHAVKATMSILK